MSINSTSTYSIRKRAWFPIWLLNGTALVWFGALIVVFSDMGVDLGGFVILFFSGLALFFWWVIQAVVFFWGGADRQGFRLRTKRALASIFFAIVVLLCGALLTNTSILQQVRLRISEPALLRYVDAFERGQPLPGQPGARKVGLFTIRETEGEGDITRMITTSCGLNDCGLAYAPAGPPPDSPLIEDSYTHLFGPWWRLLRSW